MLSSKQFRDKYDFITEFAKIHFGKELMENYADVRSDEIYYVKGSQVISMSTHALKDGKDKNRLWWDDENHLKDPNFLNFADKVLDKLKNYNSLPPKGKYDIPKPERQLNTKIGVCDAKELKGWVIALQYSKDENQSLDSFHVVTILNKNSGTMNMQVDLFAKKDVYIVNVDKQIVKVASEDELLRKELADINIKLANLEDMHDIAYIEYDDEQDPKTKLKKKKEYESLIRQIEQLRNRKVKLDKTLGECYTEVYTVLNSVTNESMDIIVI